MESKNMPVDDVCIIERDINCEDARILLDELNSVLTVITGDDGTSNFKADDTRMDKSVFVIAYFDNVPCGCGAIRKMSETTAEIKRIYARKNEHGVGYKVVSALEEKARQFGYNRLLLETRVQNVHAIDFYHKMGYIHCEPYGRYVGKENAYCFEKEI